MALFSLVIGQDRFLAFFGVETTAVTIAFSLYAVHQTGHLGDIVDIGRSGFNLLDSSGILIRGDVTFVAEVSLIALLDLMCSWIPFFLGYIAHHLQHVDPQQQFEIVELIATLSLVIERLDYCHPLASRNQLIRLLPQKFLLVRLRFCQFIHEERYAHLLISHNHRLGYLLRVLCVAALYARHEQQRISGRRWMFGKLRKYLSS